MLRTVLTEANNGLRGFRTILIGAAMMALDILQATDVAPILPPAWLPFWMVAQPVILMGLRCVTRTPLGRRAA